MHNKRDEKRYAERAKDILMKSRLRIEKGDRTNSEAGRKQK